MFMVLLKTCPIKKFEKQDTAFLLVPMANFLMIVKKFHNSQDLADNQKKWWLSHFPKTKTT